MKKRVIVATDLTEAGNKAVLQAMHIAHGFSAELTLFHVADEKSIPVSVIENSLRQEAERIHLISGKKCKILLLSGNFVEEIVQIASGGKYCLMVIATHAIRGVKQMILGSDILRLVMKIPIPVLVVQKDSPLITEFRQIILPVASHVYFNAAIEAVMLFASAFNAVIVIYYVEKPGYEMPARLAQNIEETRRIFIQSGIQHQCIKEDQNVYSPFYSDQILNFACQNNADCICMMSVPSKEYFSFAQSEKETLLMNECHIPVLCAGGGTKEQGKDDR